MVPFNEERHIGRRFHQGQDVFIKAFAAHLIPLELLNSYSYEFLCVVGPFTGRKWKYGSRMVTRNSKKSACLQQLTEFYYICAYPLRTWKLFRLCP